MPWGPRFPTPEPARQRTSPRCGDAFDMPGMQGSAKPGHAGPVDRAHPQAIKRAAPRQSRRNHPGRQPIHRIRGLPLNAIPAPGRFQRAAPGAQLNPGNLDNRLYRRLSNNQFTGTDWNGGMRLAEWNCQHEHNRPKTCNGAPIGGARSPDRRRPPHETRGQLVGPGFRARTQPSISMHSPTPGIMSPRARDTQYQSIHARR
jgi:hypothetical protein